MDIQLKKKPWYIRHKKYVIAGTLSGILLIWMLILSFGPLRMRVNTDNIRIAQVSKKPFLEFMDVEGTIQPILTIQVNTCEKGSVAKIVAEEGSMLEAGDTILILDNPDLILSIDEEHDEWRKQQTTLQKEQIEMEQKSILLKKQVLQNDHELKQLERTTALDREEFKMGIKSKAQLQMAEDECDFKRKSNILQRESLRHDSTVTAIRQKLIKEDMERERKKYMRAANRKEKLVVRAPISGQLSIINVIPGQQVNSGISIAEIKVTTQFKVRTSLDEYYIDRITTGLPASIMWQNKKYQLKVSKIMPEIKNRTFTAELAFVNESPDNIQIGKNIRVQIELGQPENAIVVDRDKFFQSTQGEWIYKLNADKSSATKVPISLGRQNPKQYEVLDGLKPGDWVIISEYNHFENAEELIIE